MTDTKASLTLSKYEDEILDLIETQLKDTGDGLTQSDLQGAVMALVRKIYNHD